MHTHTCSPLPLQVQFLGAVTKTEPYMIVTEYMPGGSLTDVFKASRKLTIWRAVQVHPKAFVFLRAVKVRQKDSLFIMRQVRRQGFLLSLISGGAQCLRPQFPVQSCVAFLSFFAQPALERGVQSICAAFNHSLPDSWRTALVLEIASDLMISNRHFCVCTCNLAACAGLCPRLGLPTLPLTPGEAEAAALSPCMLYLYLQPSSCKTIGGNHAPAHLR
eukprot:1159423-Pelagomonas_calceolata.AAC.2